MEDELNLILQAKTNIQAFDKLYAFYFKKIYSYIYRRLLNRENAEDVTSKVFLKAVEHIFSFDSKKSKSLAPWLYRIAHNELINFYKERKSNAVYLDQLPEVADSINIEEQVIKLKTIQVTLFKLKPKYQELLTLKYIEHLENSEIAKVMEVSEANVRVIQNRALKAFKKELNKKL